MHTNVIHDSRSIELLMDACTTSIRQLSVLIHIEAPVKPMALDSDCCGSNNYPE
jgi:hypothetical protein